MELPEVRIHGRPGLEPQTGAAGAHLRIATGPLRRRVEQLNGLSRECVTGVKRREIGGAVQFNEAVGPHHRFSSRNFKAEARFTRRWRISGLDLGRGAFLRLRRFLLGLTGSLLCLRGRRSCLCRRLPRGATRRPVNADVPCRRWFSRVVARWAASSCSIRSCIAFSCAFISSRVCALPGDDNVKTRALRTARNFMRVAISLSPPSISCRFSTPGDTASREIPPP